MRIKKLERFISERAERNAEGQAAVVFSVTNTRGLSPAEEQFGKRVHSVDTTRYKVVRPNWFAYNPARVNVGSIDRLTHDQPVAVSPMYVVFEVTTPELDPHYLLYFLKSPVGNAAIRAHCQGSVRSILPFGGLASIELPMPDPPEQRRIVAILDGAGAARRKRREALALTDRLLQAVFLDMFGDPLDNAKQMPVYALGRLVANGEKISYGVLKRGPDVPDGIPLVDAGSVRGGTVDVTELKRISQSLHDQYVRTQLRGGEVVVTIRGTVGRSGVVPDELRGANVSRQIAVLPLRGDVSPHYVVWALMSPGLQRWMAERVRGAAQRGINLADLRQVPIPLAPTEARARFDDVAEEVQHLRSCEDASLLGLDELFISLVMRSFAGKLTNTMY